DTTRDASATGARGIRNLVVSVGMDDQRTSIRVEQRRRTGCERHPIGGERNGTDATRRNHDVRVVSRVRSPWILEAMFQPHRIVVPAGSRERRCTALAPSDFMEMNSMGAGR